jgi:hypothetical protein
MSIARPEFPGGLIFHGFLHMRIPSSFLQTVYGIDDPSTVTDTGLAASVGAGGGTVTVSVEPGGGALLVDISGMTFSPRTLTIRRGVVTPTVPNGLATHRISARRGKVSFHAARPRGSRITGYRLRCFAGHQTVNGSSKRSPIVVSGLHRGRTYRCTVWAQSKDGAGLHSRSITLPT